MGMDVGHDEITRLAVDKVLCHALKPVVDDFDRHGPSPDVDWALGAVVVAPQEGIKSCNVVDVDVGEQEGFDRLELCHGQIPQACLTAVGLETLDRLARVDFEEQGVVSPGLAKDLIVDRSLSLLFVPQGQPARSVRFTVSRPDRHWPYLTRLITIDLLVRQACLSIPHNYCRTPDPWPFLIHATAPATM
jgi:hypothetical protein